MDNVIIPRMTDSEIDIAADRILETGLLDEATVVNLAIAALDRAYDLRSMRAERTTLRAKLDSLALSLVQLSMRLIAEPVVSPAVLDEIEAGVGCHNSVPNDLRGRVSQ